ENFKDFKIALSQVFNGAISFESNGVDVTTPITEGAIPVDPKNPQCLSSRGKEKLNLSSSLNETILEVISSNKDLEKIIPQLINHSQIPPFSIQFYKTLKSKMKQKYPNFNITKNASKSREYFAELNKNIAELASDEEMKRIRDSFQKKCSKLFSHITNLLCQKEDSHIAITSEKYHKVDFNPKEENDDDLFDEFSDGEDDENHKKLVSYCREREDAIFIARDPNVIGSDSSPCQTFSQDMPLMSISERDKAMEITTPHILFNQEELACLSQSLNETEEALAEPTSKKDKDALKIIQFEDNICLHLSCKNYALTGGTAKLAGGKCDPRESPELYSAIQELQQFNCSKEPERVDEMCNKGEMTLAFQNILELYLEQCLEGGEECIGKDNIDTILGKDTDLRKYYDTNIDRVRTSHRSRKNITGNDFSSDWAVSEFLNTDLESAQNLVNLRGFDKSEVVKLTPKKEEAASTPAYASSSTSQAQVASKAPTVEQQVIMDNSSSANTQLERKIERDRSSIIAKAKEMTRQQNLLSELTRAVVKANSIKASNKNKRYMTKDDYFKSRELDARIRTLTDALKETPSNPSVDSVISDGQRITGTFIPAPKNTKPAPSFAYGNNDLNRKYPASTPNTSLGKIGAFGTGVSGATNSTNREDSVESEPEVSTGGSSPSEGASSIQISEEVGSFGGSGGSSGASRAPGSVSGSGGFAGLSSGKYSEEEYDELENVDVPEIVFTDDNPVLDEGIEKFFQDNSEFSFGHPLKIRHENFKKGEYIELAPMFENGEFSHYSLLGTTEQISKFQINNPSAYMQSLSYNLKLVIQSAQLR
ncbi:MAG: hypothetical protein ACPGJV_10275, partial [Bacteriovoracaceae bacterium]